MRPSPYFNDPVIRQGAQTIGAWIAGGNQRPDPSAQFLNEARTAVQLQDLSDKKLAAEATAGFRGQFDAIPAAADDIIGASVSGQGPIPMIDPRVAFEQATTQALPGIGLAAAKAGVDPKTLSSLALSAPFEEAMQRRIQLGAGNGAGFNMNTALTPDFQVGRLEDKQAHDVGINDANIAGAFARTKYSSDSSAATQRQVAQMNIEADREAAELADLILNQGQVALTADPARAARFGVEPGVPVTGSFETSAGAVTDVPDGQGGFTRLEGPATEATAKGAAFQNPDPNAPYRFPGQSLPAAYQNLLLQGSSDPAFRATPEYSRAWNETFNEPDNQVTTSEGGIAFTYPTLDPRFPPPTGTVSIHGKPPETFDPIFAQAGATPAAPASAPVVAPAQDVASVDQSADAFGGVTTAPPVSEISSQELSDLASGAGGNVAGSQRKLTQEETRRIQFATSMYDAKPFLDAIGNDDYMPGFAFQAVSTMNPKSAASSLLYRALSERDKLLHQESFNWVDGLARFRTGAAIKDEELPYYLRTYAPQPGDSPTILQAKRRRRATMERIFADPNQDPATLSSLVNQEISRDPELAELRSLTSAPAAGAQRSFVTTTSGVQRVQ